MGDFVLREFGELMFARPGLDASPATIAAWYERKAALFERIAADGAAEPDEARKQAQLARRRAEMLTHQQAA